MSIDNLFGEYKITVGYWSDKYPDMCKLAKLEEIKHLSKMQVEEEITHWKNVVDGLADAMYRGNNIKAALDKLGIPKEEMENIEELLESDRMKVRQILEEKYGFDTHLVVEKHEWTEVCKYDANKKQG